MPSLPSLLRTKRLVVRAWSPDDAAALAPILAANVAHLSPWIPERVWQPAPPQELATRLRGFADAFREDREYRFAILSASDGALLGEADLFPRDARGRVELDRADRVELGYWLDAGATGRGYASEAMRALIDEAEGLRAITRIEIRCDGANAASVAIPRRLGFGLDGEDGGMQVWARPTRPA